jgi:hypothetical protein
MAIRSPLRLGRPAGGLCLSVAAGRALLPGRSASLQSRAPQRGRYLPPPAFGLPHHSFCQGAEERQGNCHGASGGAGAPAAGIARAGGPASAWWPPSSRGNCGQGEEAGGGRDGAISPRALHDAEGALRSGGALRGGDGADRGDRSEGVVAE